MKSCINAFSIFISNRDVMYLLDKLKPFEQKEYISLKEQNGLGWNLAYVCVGPVLKWGLNLGPPGWKVRTNPLNH